MRAVPARPPYLESKVQQPQFVFARRYSREKHADESKVIGVDGYVPQNPDTLKDLEFGQLHDRLYHANMKLLQMCEAYLELLQQCRNSRSRDYGEITKLREHYRPVCQHEWSAEWRETNHAFRKCQWCHAIDKRAGGGAWTGD